MRRFYSWLPTDYYVDLSEPDLRILKRPDNSMVAAFLPEFATREKLQRTADSDYLDCREHDTNWTSESPRTRADDTGSIPPVKKKSGM